MITEKEKAILDVHLHIDDVLLSDWVDIGDSIQLREKGIEMLSKSNVGSWIVRKSSVKENETIIPRVISFYKTDKNPYEDKIFHLLIARIPGLGYISFDVKRGEVITREEDENPKMIKIYGLYASFADLIKEESKKCGFIIKNKI